VTGWRYFASEPAASSPPASNPAAAPPSQAAQAPGPAKTLPQPVQLGKLEPVPEEPGGSRNPFRFGTPPAPPPAPRPPQVQQPPPAPMPPPQPQGPPRIALTFIGRQVRPDGLVVAALKDPAGNIFQAIDGQLVDGRYRVVRIAEESLVIEYANGTGRITLPLR
jgi:hypothetical protein